LESLEKKLDRNFLNPLLVHNTYMIRNQIRIEHMMMIKNERFVEGEITYPSKNPSGKDVTRFKIFSLEDILSIDTSNKLANIPLEILLENTFTRDTESIT